MNEMLAFEEFEAFEALLMDLIYSIYILIPSEVFCKNVIETYPLFSVDKNCR